VGQRDTDLVRLAGAVASHQRELARAVEDLQHARRAAEDANQIKRNFLRIMTHELKTPITAMQLHLRLLERDPEASASPKLREGLDRIARASRRLVYLIDTVLEWARVESGRCQLSMEPLDLRAMVGSVAAELEGYAKQKHVAIETRCVPKSLPPALGDPRLVQLLIVNLLSHAVQVTPRGRIEVTIGHDSAIGHWISVRDGSAPIPSDQRSSLFDPLRQAKGLHEYTGTGSGLGLHVVRDIARAFNGDVTLTPADGPGNTFMLTIPDVLPGRTAARVLQSRSGWPDSKSPGSIDPPGT
jgi:signal transduction histidine kinase